MPNVPNAMTSDILRAILRKEGYALNAPVGAGEAGADIIATRGDEIIHVEVIGLKENRSNRARDFYKAFFQALTNIGNGAKVAAIAMPIGFASGIQLRATHRGTAWTRVGDAFEELEIWLVDTENRKLERKKWNDWATVAQPSAPTGLAGPPLG